MCAIKRGAEREPEKAGKAFGGRRAANLHPPQPKGIPTSTRGTTHHNPPEGRELGMLLQDGVIGLIRLVCPIRPIGE